jgi:hypothetical protein
MTLKFQVSQQIWAVSNSLGSLAVQLYWKKIATKKEWLLKAY